MKRPRQKTPVRQLGDLVSIGPAMLRDFKILGIRSVPQLARLKPLDIYRRLEKMTGHRQDPCVLDTFSAAVAQAKNPRLPREQCQWWYWSRLRKSRKKIKDAKINTPSSAKTQRR